MQGNHDLTPERPIGLVIQRVDSSGHGRLCAVILGDDREAIIDQARNCGDGTHVILTMGVEISLGNILPDTGQTVFPFSDSETGESREATTKTRRGPPVVVSG